MSALSPLMAPDSTAEPGVFEIRYGSPVRYDSSITPCPSSTTPSTGQVSWGRTITSSPMASDSSGTSSRRPATLRCATEGMRRASASSTEEALRTA